MDDLNLISPGEHEDELAAQAAEGSEHEPEAPNENWLVSYADLMTLLFGFFAMLYLTQAMLPPPPAEAPPPAQRQEQKPEKAKEEPTPAAPEASIPTESGAAAKAGGNRGFHNFEFLPINLILAMAAVSLLYVLLYFLSTRRHRVMLDPSTGAALVRRVPMLKLQAAAQKELTPEEAALRAKEAEILGSHEEIEIEEHHEEVAHMADERWLISYADLMTLLFGFYAMLYLMGPNFEAVKSSMDEAFTKSQKMRMSNLKPIDLPKMAVPSLPPPVPIPVAPIETQPSIPTATVAETQTATATVSQTIAEVQTQTAVQTAVETQVKLKPRPTPTREELQRQEEERLAALKDIVKERMQAQAEADAANKRAMQRMEGGAGGSSKGDGKADGAKGKGGSGIGGGQGGGVGAGTTANIGSAICSEGALTPYNPRCWGSGFFGCLTTDQLSMAGGQNGGGGALEFYCIRGRTRVCLTYEYCPWRGGTYNAEDYPNGYGPGTGQPSTMTCSPAGLPISTPGQVAEMAVCRGHANCGFTSLQCDGQGNLHVKD